MCIRDRVQGGQDALTSKSNLLVEDIDLALSKVDGWTTGAGSILSPIPGTPQHELSQILESIKAHVGFDELQKMRDNSPTGGALGQVTEKEIALLQALQGTMTQGLSPELLKRNLIRYRNEIETSKKQRTARFESEYSDYINKEQETAEMSRLGFSEAADGSIDWTGN